MTQPMTKDERALHVLSVVFGSIAVVAYPLAASYPQAIVLMFTIPLVIATTGRLRGSRRLQTFGLALGIAMAAAYVTQIGLFIEVVLAVGPAGVLYLVGTMLRARDRTTARVWVIAAALAYVVGVALMPTSANAGAAAALPVTAFGMVVTILRLRRSLKTDA